MKTRIVIDIESKDMKKILLRDMEGEDITKDTEREIHSLIDENIRDYIDSTLECDIFDSDYEYLVAEYDNLTDYGDWVIKIKTEKDKGGDGDDPGL